METTLSKEKEVRNITENVTIEDIAKESSLIPMLVEDDGEIKEVLFCESISGGADEIDNMPRSLTLTKLKIINGELHTFMANYFLIEVK